MQCSINEIHGGIWEVSFSPLRYLKYVSFLLTMGILRMNINPRFQHIKASGGLFTDEMN